MAADLVLKSSIPQTFVHDLESAFWVMIWVALLYLPSNWDTTDRSSFIRGTMNPPVFRGSGGFNKIHYMQSGRSLSGLRFDGNEILDQLLSNLKMALAVRHPTPIIPMHVLGRMSLRRIRRLVVPMLLPSTTSY
jgi:hypothetical protein